MPAFDAPLPCRSITDHAAGGAWQMAVDEVLLESAAHSGLASLRFYQWSEPTLSLGYFQSCAQRGSHRASRDCPLVRRQTGGGAILHDNELTYSLAMREPRRSTAECARLYQVVHTALADVLASLGVEASLYDGAAGLADEERFLCFLRRAEGDVLVGGSKVCGSAQRRRAGAVLQHGSLLLARSASAPELSGLAELTGKSWQAADLVGPLRREIATRLGLALNEGRLSDTEMDRVRTLAIEKYDSAAWNTRR
jgi:lipoate-protein ligase A